MKYVLLAQLLVLSTVAFGGDTHASCELVEKSIMSRSSTGIAQVSNVGDIQVTCHVPARPFPTTPGGEGRRGLNTATKAIMILPDGGKPPVPSETRPTGGGFGPDPEPEYVLFYVHIPLEPAERDAEVQKYFARIEKLMVADGQQVTDEVRKRALEQLSGLVYQHRVGHFLVECRVLDGERVMGVGNVEFEVLFKGRFSDLGLPASPPV